MNWISLFISFVLVVVTGIWFFFKKRFSYFEKHGVPHLKPSFPLGNLKGAGSDYHLIEIITKIYEECKGKEKVAGFYNLLQKVYLVTDLETVKAITVKDFSNFVNRGFFVNEEYEPLSGHMFSLEDDRWRFIRNKLSPVFTSGKIKHMYTTVSDLAKNFVGAVEKELKIGSSVEIKDIANRFTVDVISSVAFGMEANTLDHQHEELINIFKELSGEQAPSLFFFFLTMACPNLVRFFKIRQFSKEISDFFTNVVGENIKYREDNNDNRNDFLSMLIQLKNKGSIDGEFSTEIKKLTLNECLAQAFLFFLAGSDTSSTTISFALVELAHNQEYQEKLRMEIQEKTKDTNGEITYEILHEMTYLNQVVNETLRKYTPGFNLFRVAKEDYKIPESKITIPKGSSIWIPSICIQNDDRFWENPKKFDPERFTNEEISKRPAQSFFPFGEGPRNCIGMRFGLVNVKYGVAMMIKNFKVTPDARMAYPIELCPKLPSLQPKGGFLLNFEKV